MESKVIVPNEKTDGRWRKWQRSFFENNTHLKEIFSDLEIFEIMQETAQRLEIELQPFFISKASIKKRGWSDKLIATYLGEPKLQKNPVYSSMPPTQLFPLIKVLLAEANSEEVQNHLFKKSRKGFCE